MRKKCGEEEEEEEDESDKRIEARDQQILVLNLRGGQSIMQVANSDQSNLHFGYQNTWQTTFY